MNGGLDDDSAQFRWAARIIAVSTTIRAILIGGEDNCGFDDDFEQFISAVRTIAVSITIRRNFDWWRGQLCF